MRKLPLTEVGKNLSSIIEGLSRGSHAVTITKRGHPAAVLMSADYFEGLQETVDILSDPAALRAIRQAERDIAAGRVHRLEDIKALRPVRRS